MARFSEKISAVFLILSSIAIICGWVNFSFSLVLGFLFALFIGNPYQLKTQWASGHLLKLSIVLMGLGLNIKEVWNVAQESFLITLITIAFALSLGFLLGKLFNVDNRLSFLISGGTAICGGSAIAALAPAIQAKPQHLLVSISIIFLLNAAGLIVYPYLGDWLSMSQYEFGLWSALGIHDTSSVVGAAASFGEESLEVATTTKLARALWIIPLVIFAGFVFKNESKNKFPLFILFFIAASLLGSYVAFFGQYGELATLVAKRGMALSLFLIGAGFSKAAIREMPLTSFWQGLVLWIGVSLFSLWLVTHF